MSSTLSLSLSLTHTYAHTHTHMHTHTQYTILCYPYFSLLPLLLPCLMCNYWDHVSCHQLHQLDTINNSTKGILTFYACALLVWPAGPTPHPRHPPPPPPLLFTIQSFIICEGERSTSSNFCSIILFLLDALYPQLYVCGHCTLTRGSVQQVLTAAVWLSKLITKCWVTNEWTATESIHWVLIDQFKLITTAH